MIVRLTAPDLAQIEPLVASSHLEGFRFVKRLCEEWANGANRFDRRGEALFGVCIGGGLVGVGGITRQDDSTGRLRRFYILPSYRRHGWGRQLLHHILVHAAEHFRWVVLRTDTDSADRFYCACGFARIRDLGDATHGIELARTEPGTTPNGGPARVPVNSDATDGPPGVS